MDLQVVLPDELRSLPLEALQMLNLSRETNRDMLVLMLVMKWPEGVPESEVVLVKNILDKLFAAFSHLSSLLDKMDLQAIDGAAISPLAGLAENQAKDDTTSTSTLIGTMKTDQEEAKINLYKDFAIDTPFKGRLSCFETDGLSGAISEGKIRALLKQMLFPSLSSVTRVPPRDQPWMKYSSLC
ncbi:hypothetical protein PHLGIDRAFT_120722 [Phlebiopsis gigantea 11061_1 CR5-6]|uniref:Uncharacterized protein n=1 Tax=Phlebiopsis gigantea (strain 11061_1 CR5-6) TaxID=745531 RepID=A0A0C3RU39_PHLG1|nr:hypothetical protein PHLGIDRAFT_120722 [Phlebiopsis gigantea 11061_1 CR5-6]